MISTERAKDLRDALKSDILRADESQAQLLKSAENRRHALERGGGAEVILLKADQLIQRLGCPVIKLHTAAGRGDAAALQSLLDSGVSANATDDMKQGWTSLHAAAENGHAECIEILMRHGADPSLRDDLTGNTALLWACYWGHAECVKALIWGGADHTEVDSLGRGPKQVGSVRQHRAVVDIIKLKEASLRVEEWDAHIRQVADESEAEWDARKDRNEAMPVALDEAVAAQVVKDEAREQARAANAAAATRAGGAA